MLRLARARGGCRHVTIAALALPVLATLAHAQDTTTTHAYELGEVVVSGHAPVSEASGTVRTITSEDIRASGARTLDEALDLLPGLHVRTGGDGVPRIDVRGFRPRHVLLLLDGVPLNSTYDGQFDPTLIPVEEIAYIKMTPGPSSVLYGANELAGTINIITRRGGGPAHGEVGTEARERDAALLRANAGGGSDRISAFASASGFRTDGYFAPASSPSLASSSDVLRGNTDRKLVSLFGSVHAQPTSHVTLGLVLSGVHGAYGIPTTVITDSTDPFATRPTYERVPLVDQRSAQLAASYAPTGPIVVRSWAYTDRYREDHDRYDDSTYSSMSDSLVSGTYRQSSRSLVSGIGVQTTADGAAWGRLTLGLSAEHDDWTSKLHIRDVPVTPTGGTGGGTGGGSGGGGKGGGGGGGGGGTTGTIYRVRDVADSRRLDHAGVALEYELRPVQHGGLVLGYAHDWLAKDSAGSDDAASYSAGVYYDLTPRTRLHASGARKVRFPTISQLYDPTGGNPSLHDERANEYEAGIEQALPARSQLSLTGFRTDVQGFIQRPAPGQHFANFDAYRFDGVEVVAETRAIARTMLRAGYSFLDTQDRSPGSTREALQYEPRHKLTLDARYAFRVGPSIALSVMRVAGQVYYARGQQSQQQGALPNYTVANVRVAQQILRSAVSVYAGADNLFDEAYEDEYGYPQPGRTLYAGAAVRW
ncbi:MAG TPA: TonB-dependent receptor [Gemmatimonadaceae bacterium]